jgi:hypothetical protein
MVPSSNRLEARHVMPGPHDHSHAHKTGLPWLDLFIAGCALVVSAASLIVAVQHGRSMDRMVQSASWPYLAFINSNYDDARNVDTISLVIRNNGVGPARLESFEMSLDGKPLRNMRDLFAACCGVDVKSIHTREDFQSKVGFELTSSPAPNLVPARDQLTVLQFAKATANPDVYKKLNDARFRLKPRACYCSVFDECWVTDLQSMNPEKVEKCDTKGTVQYSE